MPHAPDQHIEELTYNGPEIQADEPADIVWVNRGGLPANGGNGTDGDRFQSVFGANAENARLVVDAVIRHFERMIGSFNYSNGTNNFSLTLSMSSTGSSLGASASLSQVLNGIPKAGSVTMGRGGGGTGGGWFIDTTPDDNAEFLGNIVNAFSGDAHAGSPAAGMSDFYTVVCAEVTHTLGLYGHSSLVPGFRDLATNTNIPDTAEGGSRGTFYVFRGPSIKHLLTSNNGGASGSSFAGAVHSAGPNGAGTAFDGDTYIGGQDIGNAVYEQSRRYIPNLAFALMFKDAFNYGSVDPSQFGSMYVIQNETTGAVTVRGTTGIDTINVTRNGSTLSIGVDPVNDVGGTGALPGAGDLPAWTTNFDIGEVSSISILASSSNDTINFSGDIGVPVTVDGGGGIDSLNVTGSGGDDSIVVTPTALTINGVAHTTINFELRKLDGAGGNDLLDASALVTLSSLYGGSGNDTLIGGSSSDQLEGQDGIDQLAGNAGPDFLTAGSGDVARGGDANDTINIIADGGSAAATIGGDGGDDTVVVNGGANAVFDTSEDLASLTIGFFASATIAPGGANVLRTQALNVDGAGSLDLSNNAAIIDYSGTSLVNEIEAAIISGYNGGAWDGAGIRSSTAATTPATGVGYGEASDLFSAFPASFAGQSIDDTTLLLSFTLSGDADLNRFVDIGDFSLLAANFNTVGTRWTRGNFNYDGVTDISDFSLVAANFNQARSRRAPSLPPLFSGNRVEGDLAELEGAWAQIA